MERKYFVIRITNENEAFDDIRNEFLAGRLRQGWGPKGADLRGEPVSFITALKERWAESMENTPRRYSILLPMTKIQRGDIIIVPKLSINQYGMGNYFTVAECTAEYTFEPLEAYNDYGHILGIKTLGTWDYRSYWKVAYGHVLFQSRKYDKKSRNYSSNRKFNCLFVAR